MKTKGITSTGICLKALEKTCDLQTHTTASGCVFAEAFGACPYALRLEIKIYLGQHDPSPTSNLYIYREIYIYIILEIIWPFLEDPMRTKRIYMYIYNII